MSRLFAELYLDEDVDVLLKALLAAHGFSAKTTLESDNLASSDPTQLQFASENKLALVTHNRLDFERLAVAYHDSGKVHAGIVIATRKPARELANRLIVILNSHTADELANQLVYI